MEEWRKVLEHPDYEVSNEGNVRKNLKQMIDSEGYPTVTVDGHKIRVHKLEMEAFYPDGNPDGTLLVDHGDGNKENRNLSNLEYVTPKENSQRASKMGLLVHGHKQRKILVINMVTKEEKVYPGQHKAAKALGIHDSEINKCLRGRRKSSHGYKFKYYEEIENAENT